VVAVVLVVLATTGGSPSHKPASRASAPPVTIPRLTQPSPARPTPGTAGSGSTSPATAITGRTVDWLGMQVATVQGTGAVVQTVQLGTPADAAGLDPGDVIQTINGHAIAAAQQITRAVRGLSRGAAVNISVERGSTLFTTVAAFDSHPTTSP
jgi:S1-C subfamily serine protease